MKKFMIMVIGILLLLSESGMPCLAQDEFKPGDPPEPNQNYKLSTACEPVDAGYVSGSGLYQEGTSVWINASSRSSNYVFDHWTLNGQGYSSEQGFNYVTVAAKGLLTAYFKYVPESPAEPTLVIKKRLYLNSTPQECCSFNRTSGEKVETDSYVEINCYANSGYNFLGWYANGVKVSTVRDFNYQMPSDETTLTAMFKYSPSNPDEPGSAGGDIQNLSQGDVNGDTVINATDAVEIINAVVTETASKISLGQGDVNNDKVINATDAVDIINYSIESK